MNIKEIQYSAHLFKRLFLHPTKEDVTLFRSFPLAVYVHFQDIILKQGSLDAKKAFTGDLIKKEPTLLTKWTQIQKHEISSNDNSVKRQSVFQITRFVK